MPWNGSGVFTRNFSWVNDAANNIPITASRMDGDSNDFVSNGFGNTLTRDGQGSATANLPMNGFKHTNCAVGVASTDYATMSQISGFAPLASPALTGTPTAPNAAPGTNNTQIATTNFVTSALGSYLPLSGGTMTGTFSSATASLSVSVNQPGVGGFGTSTPSLAALAINSPGSAHGCFLSFNRLNAFACYVGIDIDNAFRIGGWSFGNTTYRIMHEGVSGLTVQSPGITGTMFYGGTAQPHIFVQSSTPTAVAVNDLWFF